MKYAINIEPLFPELDFYKKIEKVKKAGFDTIEFFGWKDKDVEQVKRTCEKNGVRISAFCGQADYSLCDREHTEAYIDWIKKSIQTARYLDCSTLIVYPNHFTPDGCSDFREKYTSAGMIANITHTLTLLAPILEENEITLLLEPLNNLGADAGMSVTDTKTGAEIVRAVNSKRVKLLCDVYHMQMMHGNLLSNILENLDIVPYLHLADAPDRFEPGTGEIQFDYLLNRMKEQGYQGITCFEYFPKDHNSERSLKAAKELCGRIQ